jgi:parvulin-like peptidyl-prolyl isomerase
VVAVINGKRLTAAELDALIAGFPKTQQQNFQRDPKRFLQEYAQMQLILETAEKDGLAAQSPYKEQLADLDRQYQQFRRQVMYTAALNESANRVVVSNEDVAKRYQENQAKYREAKVKVIYIPFSATTDKSRQTLSEADARAKAEKIAEQARSGADFVKLVKEHSEDPSTVAQNGDLGVGVRADTEKVPQEIRTAVLAARQGEIVGPVRSTNGFYVFRVESMDALPLAKVRDEIYKEIQNAGMMNWLAQMRNKSSVAIENEAYFRR